MTAQKVTIWQKINRPITWKILPWVLLGIWIIWFIFKSVPDHRKTTEENNQLKSHIEVLEEDKVRDSIFRNIIINKIATLQSSVDRKETDKIRIYERIQNDIHHYDTSSIEEYQRFFDDRYNPKPQSNTDPGTGAGNN